jgi:hypothetical protein
MDEIACVGAGVGGGPETTTELHVMEYNAAMETPDALGGRKQLKMSTIEWYTTMCGSLHP